MTHSQQQARGLYTYTKACLEFSSPHLKWGSLFFLVVSINYPLLYPSFLCIPLVRVLRCTAVFSILHPLAFSSLGFLTAESGWDSWKAGIPSTNEPEGKRGGGGKSRENCLLCTLRLLLFWPCCQKKRCGPHTHTQKLLWFPTAVLLLREAHYALFFLSPSL